MTERFSPIFYSACVGGWCDYEQMTGVGIRSIRWNFRSPWGWGKGDSPELSRLGHRVRKREAVMPAFILNRDAPLLTARLWQGEVLQLELVYRSLTVDSCTRFSTLPKIAKFLSDTCVLLG